MIYHGTGFLYRKLNAYFKVCIHIKCKNVKYINNSDWIEEKVESHYWNATHISKQAILFVCTLYSTHLFFYIKNRFHDKSQ